MTDFNYNLTQMRRFILSILIGGGAAGAFLILFAKLVEDLIFNELLLFDRLATALIREQTTPVLTVVMKFFTALGSSKILVPVFLVILVVLYRYFRQVWESVALVLATGGALLLNEALKWLFHRPRPALPWLTTATGYSFPSGHAMISLAFFGMLGFVIWTNFRGRWGKVTAIVVGAIVPLIIGTSRVYLGVHYPSDVLAGFAAGGFWLAGVASGLWVFRFFKPVQKALR